MLVSATESRTTNRPLWPHWPVTSKSLLISYLCLRQPVQQVGVEVPGVDQAEEEEDETGGHTEDQHC